MLAKLKMIFPYIMFQGIETSTIFGFPDVIYGFDIMMGLIELKKLDRVPVRKFKMPWRPGQLAWYHNYAYKYHNKRPYIVVLTILDDWYFIHNIKQYYTMDEIKNNFVGCTKDLNDASIQSLIMLHLRSDI